MSALGRAQGVGTDLGAGLSPARRPAPRAHRIYIKEDGPGMPGQQREETGEATGRPLRRDVMHSFKAVSKISFVS